MFYFSHWSLDRISFWRKWALWCQLLGTLFYFNFGCFHFISEETKQKMFPIIGLTCEPLFSHPLIPIERETEKLYVWNFQIVSECYKSKIRNYDFNGVFLHLTVSKACITNISDCWILGDWNQSMVKCWMLWWKKRSEIPVSNQ